MDWLLSQLTLGVLFFGIAALAGVVGFLMHRWHDIVRDDASLIVGRFSYVLGQASFIVVTGLLAWEAVSRLGAPDLSWRETLRDIMLSLLWTLGTVLSLISLVAQLVSDERAIRLLLGLRHFSKSGRERPRSQGVSNV